VVLEESIDGSYGTSLISSFRAPTGKDDADSLVIVEALSRSRPFLHRMMHNHRRRAAKALIAPGRMDSPYPSSSLDGFLNELGHTHMWWAWRC
jgi:hypothetical protein